MKTPGPDCDEVEDDSGEDMEEGEGNTNSSVHFKALDHPVPAT